MIMQNAKSSVHVCVCVCMYVCVCVCVSLCLSVSVCPRFLDMGVYINVYYHNTTWLKENIDTRISHSIYCDIRTYCNICCLMLYISKFNDYAAK